MPKQTVQIFFEIPRIRENFAYVVYTSREFNLSNRVFEDSPGFGEPQRIFVRSA